MVIVVPEGTAGPQSVTINSAGGATTNGDLFEYDPALQVAFELVDEAENELQQFEACLTLTNLATVPALTPTRW